MPAATTSVSTISAAARRGGGSRAIGFIRPAGYRRHGRVAEVVLELLCQRPLFSRPGALPMHTQMNRRTVLAFTAVLAALLCPAAARGATLFTLTGHGWGHGIGMSQWGALGYAQHGWGYQRILTHYYTGTSIGLLPRGTTERVLLSDGRSSIHVSFTSAAQARDGAGTTKL